MDRTDGEGSATDALVGKYIRTMAAVEWKFRETLTLDQLGLHDKPVRDDRTLEELTEQMRALRQHLVKQKIISERESGELRRAIGHVETHRPLRNKLAHSVVRSFQEGLMTREDDGSLTPLQAATINGAGSDLVWALVVFDDVHNELRRALEDEHRRPATSP